jgi:hypothetical protein
MIDELLDQSIAPKGYHIGELSEVVGRVSFRLIPG